MFYFDNQHNNEIEKQRMDNQDQINVIKASAKQEIEKLVMKNETVSKWVKESKIKKVIIIPNKIISLVC